MSIPDGRPGLIEPFMFGSRSSGPLTPQTLEANPKKQLVAPHSPNKPEVTQGIGQKKTASIFSNANGYEATKTKFQICFIADPRSPLILGGKESLQSCG